MRLDGASLSISLPTNRDSRAGSVWSGVRGDRVGAAVGEAGNRRLVDYVGHGHGVRDRRLATVASLASVTSRASVMNRGRHTASVWAHLLSHRVRLGTVHGGGGASGFSAAATAVAAKDAKTHHHQAGGHEKSNSQARQCAITAGPERAVAVVGVALGPWGPAFASLEKAGATTIATSGRSKLEAGAREACEEKSKGCLLVAGNAAEQYRGKACHCRQFQLEGIF